MRYDISLENLISIACKHITNDSEIKLIKEAYYLTQEVHYGQKRLDGYDYFVHPYTVAFNIGLYGMDYITVISALLHDSYEDYKGDKDNFRKYIINVFGREVNETILGVSKKQELEKQFKVYEYNKTLMRAFHHNVRSIIIKIEDNLNNMRTIQFLKPEKQIENASESLYKYCNFASKIGMNKAKSEMQDIAFEVLFPEDYKRVFELSEELYARNKNIYNQVFKEINYNLLSAGINHDILLRRKSLYGTYYKINEHGGIGLVHDFMAYKVIVETQDICYDTVRELNQIFGERLKVNDYIKHPKTNGYKSFHSSFNKEGVLFQTQTKTPCMNLEADYGLASIQFLYPEVDLQNYFEINYPIYNNIKKIRENVQDLIELHKETEKAFALEKIYVTDLNGEIMCELNPGSTLGDFIDTFYPEESNLGWAKVKSETGEGSFRNRFYELKTGDKIRVLNDEMIYGIHEEIIKKRTKD